jgi:hypothetical protein
MDKEQREELIVKNTIEDEYIEIAKKYKKPELVARVIKQFKINETLMGILRLLCDDNSTGHDRWLARSKARKIIEGYDKVLDDIRQKAEESIK